MTPRGTNRCFLIYLTKLQFGLNFKVFRWPSNYEWKLFVDISTIITSLRMHYNASKRSSYKLSRFAAFGYDFNFLVVCFACLFSSASGHHHCEADEYVDCVHCDAE